MILKGTGGCGGDAQVTGDDSNATGGQGGDAVLGNGGKGGDAQVRGNKSTAIGGKGGRGGIGPGMPGGDAIALDDEIFIAGGQGGESNQPDGRGGRGGRAYEVCRMLGLPDYGHIKAPYGRPNVEPGRGGDSPDTPQYMARKLIVMALKERFFIEKQLEPRDLETIWYDRNIVPLFWINETLQLRHQKWHVSIEDGEYIFSDKKS